MNQQILEQLERLAAAFPWDEVRISLERKPEGPVTFIAAVYRNEKFGFEHDCGFGVDVEQAVDALIKQQGGRRDPGIMRDKKIAELQEKIRKLEAVQIGLPPYIPNRELAAHCECSKTIEVEATAA